MGDDYGSLGTEIWTGAKSSMNQKGLSFDKIIMFIFPFEGFFGATGKEHNQLFWMVAAKNKRYWFRWFCFPVITLYQNPGRTI